MKKLTTNDAVSVIFHPEKYFCHATDVENVQSIIDNGLRANEDGDIFVFEPCRFKMYGEIFFVGDVIADGQLFLRDKYAIFYIKKKDVFGKFSTIMSGNLLRLSNIL
jgi:hypothetical protein